MQTTSSLIPSFSLPNHGYVKKDVQLCLKTRMYCSESLYIDIQLTEYLKYIIHVENLGFVVTDQWCAESVSYTVSQTEILMLRLRKEPLSKS